MSKEMELKKEVATADTGTVSGRRRLTVPRFQRPLTVLETSADNQNRLNRFLQMTEEAARVVQASTGHDLQLTERGILQVKGKGAMRTFFVDRRRPSLRPANSESLRPTHESAGGLGDGPCEREEKGEQVAGGEGGGERKPAAMEAPAAPAVRLSAASFTSLGLAELQGSELHGRPGKSFPRSLAASSEGRTGQSEPPTPSSHVASGGGSGKGWLAAEDASRVSGEGSLRAGGRMSEASGGGAAARMGRSMLSMLASGELGSVTPAGERSGGSGLQAGEPPRGRLTRRKTLSLLAPIEDDRAAGEADGGGGRTVLGVGSSGRGFRHEALMSYDDARYEKVNARSRTASCSFAFILGGSSPDRPFQKNDPPVLACGKDTRGI